MRQGITDNRVKCMWEVLDGKRLGPEEQAQETESFREP